MKKHFAITMTAILAATLAYSMAWSETTNEVRLGDYLILRVRCAAGGFTIDERVNALQLRANDMLRANKTTMKFTVAMSGSDANIYADDTLFTTVTVDDARANGDTSEKLANIWAERLRTVFKRSTPDKPGVGRPDQAGAPGNAK